MDWAGFVPVFQVFVCLRVALARVEPPTNVTFHCHNLHNVLRWSYSHSVPGLRFKVHVGTIEDTHGYPTDLWFDPPTQEADLSDLSDPNNAYFIELTAVIGKEESDPGDGFVFSYFKDSLAEQKCSVDLPPVNVTAVSDARVMFKFTHPWLLYDKSLKGRSSPKHRKRSSNNYDLQADELLPEFTYIVTMDKGHEFTCEEKVCEEQLPVDPSQQMHCLTIVGELEKMRVKSTKPYCAPPYQPHNKIYPVAIAISCAAFFAVALVSFMVYKKRTRPSESYVPNLEGISRNHSHPSPLWKEVDIIVPDLEPMSPTPLLPEESDTYIPETTDDHVPRLVEEDERGVYEARVNDEEPGYRCGDLESEDSNQTSGYERRPDVRQPRA